MLSKGSPPGHHVNVVCANASTVAPDKEDVPWRDVIPEARAPKVVVAMSLEDGHNLGSSGAKTGHLNEHVHDGLGGESGDCSAAEVLDAPDKPWRNTGAQTRGFALKQIGPARIIRRDADILAGCSLHTLFNSSQLTETPAVAQPGISLGSIIQFLCLPRRSPWRAVASRDGCSAQAGLLSSVPSPRLRIVSSKQKLHLHFIIHSLFVIFFSSVLGAFRSSTPQLLNSPCPLPSAQHLLQNVNVEPPFKLVSHLLECADVNKTGALVEVYACVGPLRN
jgi:hypothetical protein